MTIDLEPDEAHSDSSSRTIPVFEATCLLTFDTAERNDVLERFHEFCDWVSDQHDGGSRGFRFFDGFAWPTSELRALRGIERPWGQPYESWLGPAPHQMNLAVNVPALDETQATARFRGFTATVSALLAFGESRMGLLEIVPASGLKRGQDRTIPKRLEDLFFRFADDWFDPVNDGTFDDEHVRSAIMVDTHQALFPSTDDTIEAVTSLEIVVKHLPDVLGNARLWNWALIAAHHALQGFMVQALVSGNAMRVGHIDDRSKRYKLDTFLCLFKKIRSETWMRTRIDSVTYVADLRMIDSVKRLNQIRNGFIHYEPNLTTVHDTTGFPQLVRDATTIIRFLVDVSGNIVWHAHQTPLQRRTAEALNAIDEHLTVIERQYRFAETIMSTRLKRPGT